MTINKARQKPVAEGHQNFMGGVSHMVKNPILQLRLVASSAFFGQKMYYSEESNAHQRLRKVFNLMDGNDPLGDYLRETLGQALPFPNHRHMSPTQLIESAISAALDFDPEATLAEAVRLRNEDNIRDTPQVIMVMAAHHPKVRGTGLIKQYADMILVRTDDAITQLAYQMTVYGRPIPNALKKAWKRFIEGRNAYQLAKYRMESRKFKLVDLVNLVRANNPHIDQLMRGELKLDGDTWESIISAEGPSQASWTKAVEKMGHMGLLRNLRNLAQHNVAPSLYLSKLTETVKDGKQLPFRYYSAFKSIEDGLEGGNASKGQILDALETCLVSSLDEMPRFQGRVMSLCDNSGSAQSAMPSDMSEMRINQIANLTGVLTGMTADEGFVGVFGDRLEVVPVRKQASVFDQTRYIDQIGNNIGLGTEHGIWLFFDQAIQKKEHWDHIFVYSDMQAGHGGLYGLDGEYRDFRWEGSNHIDVAKLIKIYRKKVNPNVQVYLVQMAGYPDSLVPEYYDKTYILGGWGSGLLKFAHHLSTVG